jgi:hypothetical protein
MSTPSNLKFRLESIDQLFNAPDINPFSEEEVDVMGEPALLRAVKRLLAHNVKNWDEMQLVLELPADQITPDLAKKTKEAISRYSTAKIEENRIMIRLSRIRSLIGVGIVTLISLVIIGLFIFLFSTVFAKASDEVKTLVAACTSVFVWVAIWDPMEKLLFDWVQPHRENNILRKLTGLDIVIRPKS